MIRDIDFSVAENRVLAKIKKGLEDEVLGTNHGRQGVDLHRLAAARKFGVPYDEVTNRQRNAVKSEMHLLLYSPGNL